MSAFGFPDDFFDGEYFSCLLSIEEYGFTLMWWKFISLPSFRTEVFNSHPFARLNTPSDFAFCKSLLSAKLPV